MVIHVQWSPTKGKTDQKWGLLRVLYAYLTIDLNEILYIGKAYRRTVRERWNFSGKEGFWEDLERERNIFKHVVIVGEIISPQGANISEQLVSDIESLLIKQIGPWGNIQSRRSRISRPGLRVQCTDGWNNWKPEYRDVG